jgi:AraC family transcriptional regulator
MGVPLVDELSLLPANARQRWHGLEMHWLRTPEGPWSHRFTPPNFALAFVASGAIGTRMATAGRTVDVDLRSGSMVLLPGQVEVKAQQIDAAEAKRLIVELRFDRLATQSFEDHRVSEFILKPGVGFHDPELAALLRMVILELSQGCPNGNLYGESMSLGIVTHLLRTRSTHRLLGENERGVLTRTQLGRIDDFLQENLDGDLSLAALASQLRLSASHFSKIFRNSTGTSAHRYVLQARLRQAKELIETTSVPLGQIAVMVGLSSQSHLNRLYVQAYRVTPGVARRDS